MIGPAADCSAPAHGPTRRPGHLGTSELKKQPALNSTSAGPPAPQPNSLPHPVSSWKSCGTGSPALTVRLQPTGELCVCGHEGVYRESVSNLNIPSRIRLVNTRISGNGHSFKCPGTIKTVAFQSLETVKTKSKRTSRSRILLGPYNVLGLLGTIVLI